MRHIAFVLSFLVAVCGVAALVNLLPNDYLRSFLVMVTVVGFAVFAVYWYRLEIFICVVGSMYDEQQHRRPEDF